MKKGGIARLAFCVLCFGGLFGARAQSTDQGKGQGPSQAGPAATEPGGPAQTAPADDKSKEPTVLTVLERTVVTVTASRIPEEIGYIPQAVNTVSEEMLAERQPVTPNALLREEPGIFSPQVGTQGSPIIRGQIGNRVLYLWNGLRINNGALFAGPNGYFNEFPMGAIGRMEVVRGPGAVQYGSDAIGGVVNIISKHQDDFSDTRHWGGEIYGRYGSVNTEKSENGDIWGSFSRFNFAAGVTGQHIGDYAAPGIGHIQDTSLAAEGGYFDGAWRLRRKQVLRLNWIENRRDDVVSYSQSKLNPSGVPRNTNPYEERGIGRIAYEAPDLGRWSHDLRLYTYFEHFRSPRDTVVESATAFAKTHSVTSQSVAGGGIQNETSVWKSILVYGGDYRAEDLFSMKQLYTTAKTTGAVTMTIPNGNVPPGSYNVFDAFFLSRWQFGKLTVSAGGRAESTHLQSYPRPQDALTPFTVQDLTMNKRWNPLTGSAGAVYAITGDLSLVANVASGFRAPTFSDALSTGVPVFASGIATVPSPNVQPERSLTYEGGARWNSRRFSATATVYSLQLTDVVTAVSTGTIDIPGIGVVTARSNTNSGSGYVRGFETAAAFRINSQWTLLGNFTTTRGQNTSLAVPLRFIPPANGLLALVWQNATGRFHVEANTTLADRLRRHAPDDELDAGFSQDPGYGSPSATNPPYRPGYEIPGYAVENIRISVKLLAEGRRSVDLLTDFNNILNQRYREAYAQQQLLAPGFGAVVGCRWRF